MAEEALSSALSKLGELLAEEALLLYGVPDQLEWVERELRRMKSFLKEVDSSSKHKENMKQWVEDIRDTAYEAEDIADLYLFNLAQKDKISYMKRVLFIARHQAGTRIQALKERIIEISTSREYYHLDTPIEVEDEPNIQKPVRYVENEIIGLDNDACHIVEQLVDNSNRQLCVLSLVGTGGLGKTTLAQKVFHMLENQANFHVRVWITVSKDYRLIDILRKIVENINQTKKDSLEEMDLDKGTKKLQELLEAKRYLIVLDNVWSKQVWQQMQEALLDYKNGSRVIITTRSREIAKEASTIFEPHELRFLSTDESKELFLNKAFPNESCPEQLIDLVPVLVNRCGGLPLALVVLGALLRTEEKTYNAWSRKLRTMNWHFNNEGCKQILLLSYKDLPYYLKSCFLHLATFQGYEFPANS